MGKHWRSERKKDHYYKKAKTDNYRSRASFKLKQLNKKFKIIKKNNVILDLGAAPGGWMQIAGKIVGERGRVLGVDLDEIEPFEEGNISSIVGDITDESIVNSIWNFSKEYDTVICDASPDISGVWDVDHFNSIQISRDALKIATKVLSEGGNFIVKVFQGSMTKELFLDVKREFAFTKIAKPQASRQQSSEVYIVGKGFLKTPVKYGDIVDIHITETGEKGDGVGYVEEFKVFVDGGLVGENVKVNIKKVLYSNAWGEKVQ